MLFSEGLRDVSYIISSMIIYELVTNLEGHIPWSAALKYREYLRYLTLGTLGMLTTLELL